MSDIRQTPEWAIHLRELHWKVEKIGEQYVYINQFPLIGSYIKVTRFSWPIDFKRLDKIALEYKAFLIKLEPKIAANTKIGNTVNAQLIKEGFRRDFLSLTIAKTRIIRLSSNTFSNFTYNTKYSIRKALQKGIKITASDDIQALYSIYKQTAKRKKFFPIPYAKLATIYKAFKKTRLATILLAFQNSHPVAGCMLVFNKKDKMASHFIAATEKTSGRASYALTWRAMEFAMDKGYKYFDFEGIQDQRYKAMKNWGGFSKFKQGFSGEEVNYLGSYLKSPNPLLQLILRSILQ